MSQNYIRPNPIHLSDEVTFYLRILAKAAVRGTDATMTSAQVADNLLRKAITEARPELVVLYAEKEKGKKELEERMIKACSK